MKIFVTGGTGFIGSYFINAAFEAGHEIIALKRPNAKSRVALHKEPQWVVGQLDGEYQEQLQGCDAFVHLAAHTPNPPYDTLQNCLYWNVTASLNLFDQALMANVNKFLVAGTCFEYGKAGERYDYIPVDAPLEPTQTYPASKAAASVAFHGWAAVKKVQMSILRIFQVYGEGEMETRLWPSLRSAALAGEDFSMTSGEQIRDFISVEKVADEFVKALTFEGIASGETYIRNIGTGHPQSIKEFSEYWWNIWEASGDLVLGAIPYRENEVMRYIPNINDSRY